MAGTASKLLRSRFVSPLIHGGGARQGPPPASNIFTASNGNSFLTIFTFAATSIGDADATRRVVVGVSWFAADARSISSATIGGVSATIHVNPSGTARGGFISAAVPTGTTADIVVTMTGECFDLQIGVWRQINETVGTPHATQTTVAPVGNDFSVAINVPANGGLYAAVIGVNNEAEVLTTTWTGGTERYDTSRLTQVTHSGASASGLGAETGRTVTATMTGVDAGGMAAMTWG